MNQPAETYRASGERRAAPRAAVMLAASMDRGRASTPVRMANLSQIGSLIFGPLPAKGSAVTLHRNGVTVGGRIAWADGGRGGVEFEEMIDLKGMLRTVRTRRPVHHHALRRPPLRPSAFRGSERESIKRWADLLGVHLPELSPSDL